MIEHRRWGVRTVFSSDGIAVSHLIWPRYQIPWTQIEFVSPTPAYENVDDCWEISAHLLMLMPEVQQTSRLCLDVVLHDRSGFPRTAVMPMQSGDTHGKSKRGLVSLDLHIHRLSAEVSALFDLLTKFSRLDLLCRFD